MSIEENKQKIEAALSHLHPTDGFGTQVVEYGKNSTLYMVYRYSGSQIEIGLKTQCIEVVTAPTTEGTIDRDHLLLSALCRFFNTGGTPEQAATMLSGIRPMIQYHIHTMQEQGTDFFDITVMPMQLLTTGITCNETGEDAAGLHVFTTAGDAFIVEWMEGSYFGVYSRAEYNNMIERGDREGSWLELTSEDEEGRGLPPV